jgi:hypothetical protein
MENHEYFRILSENKLRVNLARIFNNGSDYATFDSPEWAPQHQYNPHYRVAVTNVETGISVDFDFWGSANNVEKLRGCSLSSFNNETREIFEDACFDAFNCLLSDAIAGDLPSFEDFCNEFGYDDDSRKAESMYKSCQDQLNKLQTVFYEDIYELANSLER